jgi:hypothetical protein
MLFTLIYLVPITVSAGDIDSPGPPSSGSGMYTIEDIYNYLIDGTEPGISSTFKEPTAGPGATMKSTKDIYDDTRAKFDSCDAAPDKVLEGVTFFRTDPANWGPRAGTMENRGAVTYTPTTTDQTVDAGYHNGSGKVQGDTDLISGNILGGIDIFGVSGSAVGATGDATVGDVLTGKTFSRLGAAGLTGTMTDVGQQNVTPGTAAVTITQGYHSGTGQVDGDADLASGNIKSGVDIFGVEGTYPLAGVPKSGVTTSYATGDDGDLQKGVAWPNPRFTDNNDNGTVTDNLTGLIWLRKADYFGMHTWANALSRCNSLASGAGALADGSVAGDWRLPNVKELLSLVHHGVYNPAVPNTAGTGKCTYDDPFRGVASNKYWTSHSSLVIPDTSAWFVNMYGGGAAGAAKTTFYYVWPVRGGQ